MNTFAEATPVRPSDPWDFSVSGAGAPSAPPDTNSYAHTNSAGITYYLHETKTGGRTLRYFSKQLNEAKAIALPLGYEVVEHGNTGMPMLKKIK